MNLNNFLEEFYSNPNRFNVAAVGDRRRYEANKMLLGEKSKYYDDPGKIPLKNTSVIVHCGERAFGEFESVPAIHISQFINFRSKKYWDAKKEYKGVDLNHHASNPYIAEYINNERKEINISDIVKEHASKHESKQLKCLSIGCGCGHLERELLSLRIFSEIHGCDISPESIDVAIEKAKEVDQKGILRYFIHDANANGWKQKYDVIIAAECVHHIERLEFFYENVKNSLAPGGIFIQAEYTGAARF